MRIFDKLQHSSTCVQKTRKHFYAQSLREKSSAIMFSIFVWLATIFFQLLHSNREYDATKTRFLSARVLVSLFIREIISDNIHF